MGKLGQGWLGPHCFQPATPGAKPCAHMGMGWMEEERPLFYGHAPQEFSFGILGLGVGSGGGETVVVCHSW